VEVEAIHGLCEACFAACVHGMHIGDWDDRNVIPQWLTALIRQKILDSAFDVVSEALSMHVVPWSYELLWYPQE
jgi:hypothetical protein